MSLRRVYAYLILKGQWGFSTEKNAQPKNWELCFMRTVSLGYSHVDGSEKLFREVKEELGFVVFAEGKQNKTCIQTSRGYS